MALLRDIPWARGLLLVAAALAVAMSFLVQDSRPASASDTRIYFTESIADPSPYTNIILNPNGPPKEIYVWVENITDPQGMASFDVDVIFDSAHVAITAIAEDVGFLTSTGRQPICVPTVIGEIPGDPDGLWHANASCASWVSSPPVDPVQGSGLLATFTLVPGPDYGISALPNESFAMDAGYIIPPSTVVDPEEIDATVMSATVQIAKCADVTGDGAVSGLDFFGLLTMFGLSEGEPGWDDSFDINADGGISGLDFFLMLGQFGEQCTQ